MASATVLSGIRATGRLHFGSLLGALQNFVHHQDDADTRCLYFVADYHTLTTLDKPGEMRDNILEIVKDYLAAGLDPERSIIYAQSSIPQIAELMLYLSMLQPLGDLQRIPTFKDLVRRNPDRVTHGLLSYPVLMTADILGPKATLVPVGSDQIPNVELARDLAVRFNQRFGDILTIPSMMEEMIKVPGLDGGKMGKSDAANSIGIDMDKKTILAKYKQSGITDPNRVTKSDPGDPYNACVSVYPVHEMVTPGEVQTRTIAKQCQTAQIGCSECKGILTESIWNIVGPFQERRKAFEKQDDLVYDILRDGAQRARSIIIPTVEEVADVMGITRF
jgi:tryptophanyl-tRNA synthetase